MSFPGCAFILDGDPLRIEVTACIRGTKSQIFSVKRPAIKLSPIALITVSGTVVLRGSGTAGYQVARPSTSRVLKEAIDSEGSSRFKDALPASILYIRTPATTKN